MKRALSLLTDIASKDRNIFLLSGDLGYNLFDGFRMACPDQFINCGIMEQNMIGVATGLSMEGKTVFVYSIATFASLRCLEQIRDDVCYSGANVKIISAGAGLNYGNLGFTHHNISDLSCLQSLPITVYNPGDVFEARACLLQSYLEKGPAYLRIGRTDSLNGLVLCEQPIDIDNGIEVVPASRNSTICILNSGPLLFEAKKVAETFGAALFSFPSVSRIPLEKIIAIAKRFKHIVTIEESVVVGGFGSKISQIVAGNSRNSKVLNLGIPVAADFTIGDHDYLKDHFGLSSVKICESISNFIKN
jgi:transketolase